MSRRIVLLAAAASAALIAGPVTADPECFGPSCRMTPQALMPQVEDPPRLSSEVMAMDATGNLVDVTPPAILDHRAQQTPTPAPPAAVAANPVPGPAANPAPAMPAPLVPPLRPVPQMVVDPVVPERPAPRYSADAAPKPPARPAARRSAQPAKRALAVEVVREPAPAQEPRRVRVVTHGVRAPEPPAAAAPNVISVAPQVHVEGSVVVVSHPNAHDPAWARCQGGPCGPASYRPYGAQGYRPLGSHRAYATAPGYIRTAPDPRIISIVADD